MAPATTTLVLSRWISADPILGVYLGGKPRGGVFDPIKLSLYTYTHLNPIVYIDPDGRLEIYKMTGELLYSDDSSNKSVYIAILSKSNELTFRSLGITQDDFHKVAATVFGESGPKVDINEMKGIAHVIKNKGEKHGKTLVESATFNKGKALWFYGSKNELAKKYLDSLKHISSGMKGFGEKARKSREAVIDAILNPIDLTQGATMFEGNKFLGPKDKRAPGSVFQEKFIDTGIAYDPLTIGETTFFKERSAAEAKKLQKENKQEE